MAQLELLYSPRFDPDTSRVAAEKSERFRASHEALIFDALHNAPDGLTYREIAEIAKLEPVKVARRLKGMEGRGLVYRRIVSVMDGKHDPWDLETRNGMCVWRKA